MKKILSLGAAAAVLSLTAVAASAAIAPEVSSEPVAGSEYVVNVVANDYTKEAVGFTLKVSDNLTYVPGSYAVIPNGPSGAFAVYNEATGQYSFASTAAPENGTVLLTLTFTVDAAADEEISVSLVPDAGFEEGVSADAVVATVLPGGEEPVTDITETPSAPVTETPVPVTETPVPVTETPSEPPVTETPVEPGPSIVTPTTPVETETNPNPPSGIALAVVPVVLAAAGVVVAKKRK